jgi:hypothetical protein
MTNEMVASSKKMSSNTNNNNLSLSGHMEGKPLRSMLSLDNSRPVLISKTSISPTKMCSKEPSNVAYPTSSSTSTGNEMETTSGSSVLSNDVINKCRSTTSPDSAATLPSPMVTNLSPASPKDTAHHHTMVPSSHSTDSDVLNSSTSNEYSQLVDMEAEDELTRTCSPRLQALHSDGYTGSNGNLPHLNTSRNTPLALDGNVMCKDEELAEAPSLVRVATFSGFDSSPVYHNTTARAMGNLKLERRRNIAITEEFFYIATTIC